MVYTARSLHGSYCSQDPICQSINSCAGLCDHLWKDCKCTDTSASKWGNVRLLIDKDAQTTKGSKVNSLLQHGIPIIIDKIVGYAHNKVIIIDDTYVITGSFNWTNSAQARNAENLVIIAGQAINKNLKLIGI